MNPSRTPHREDRSDADIWREAIELLKSRKACHQATCGWICCALSKAIGNDMESTKETWDRMHGSLVRRYGGSWWWGKPWSAEATAGRVEAMQALMEETVEAYNV